MHFSVGKLSRVYQFLFASLHGFQRKPRTMCEAHSIFSPKTALHDFKSISSTIIVRVPTLGKGVKK